MNRTLLANFGLKWNPFSPDIPVESIYESPSMGQFCWRIENAQIREGGFSLVVGDPGSGKSMMLRLLANKLEKHPELTIGILTHPSSNLGDFYRELGEIFGVDLTPSNRWRGFKHLRECWANHLDNTLFRPVLLIDEAQEMIPCVMSELRLLSSMEFDSKTLLTTVLAGDRRLTQKLQNSDLLPLASRIRVRLNMGPATRQELLACLSHSIKQAGNPKLMTKKLMEALIDHAAGNYRSLTILANEMLMEGAKQEVPELDEKLFLQLMTHAQ